MDYTRRDKNMWMIQIIMPERHGEGRIIGQPVI